MTTEISLHHASDEEARRLIRERLSQTMLVEAGAGTGKTRALVDRYVALLLAGRRVEQLAAVTFTDKAAAELRERIRGELEWRVRHGDDDAQLLLRALGSLDRAQISTIHAFALNVLRPLAAESGINPSFEVRDEVAGERRFQERWRSFLEDAGLEPDARDVVSRVLSLGLTTRDLERLAHELWRHGALADMLHASPLPVPPACMPDLTALAAELVGLDCGRVKEDDKLRASIEELQHALAELAAADVADQEALLAAVAPGLSVSGKGQSAKWGGKDAIEYARGVAREGCAALQDGVRSVRSAALAQLLPLIVRFVVEEMRARLRDGDLVFDDLILQLRNLLRDSPDGRARLRTRFKTLLIDEFQDTDPLQVEIAFFYARDPETRELEAGRLFLVGDPKQSIYRFRRADMAVYAVTRMVVVAAGGHLPQLALNRRSRSAVLGFVNATFDTLIGGGERPAIQPPYRPVHAERGGTLVGPGVGWIGAPVDEPARDIRRATARQIAAYCRAALGEGWQVGDGTGARLAGYRDIAILVPTRAILQPLERALAAASVPFAWKAAA